MDTRTHATVLAAVRATVGLVATLLPRVGMVIFGFPRAHDTPSTRMMGRLFGIRNILLGVQVFQVRDHPDRLAHVASINAAVDAADSLATATPLLRKQGIPRASFGATATALAVGTSFAILAARARDERALI